MGTTIQSPFDLGATAPWPQAEPAANLREEPGHHDHGQLTSGLLGALDEVLRWKPSPSEGSRNYLEAVWKVAAEQVSGAARNSHGQLLRQANLDGAAKEVLNNLPLLKQALVESHAEIKNAAQLPHVRTLGSPASVPRSFALGCVYLRSTGFRFEEQTFADFVAAVQKSIPLEMSEIWNLKPQLEMALLGEISTVIVRSALLAGNVDSENRSAAGHALERLSVLLNSMVSISNVEWSAYFEKVCSTETILRTDPQGVYERMDRETRESYRAAVADFAAHSSYAEPDVARRAVALARRAQASPCSSERARERRSHVGYYLLDAGQSELKKEIEYRPTLAMRTRDLILKSPDLTYLLGIELVTFAIVAALIVHLHVKASGLVGGILVLLPALECAVATVNMLATRMVPPKKVPKLDFSGGIPKSCATVVAVPALLTDEAQVRQAVFGLEVRFVVNRDPNLHFALLSDLPDSMQQFDEKESLVELACRLLRELDEKYVRENKGRFFLFHRNRLYNPAEQLWMGWERKRGKLLDFNRFLLNQGDPFPVKTGDLAVLKDIRYVITLDVDTQLPPGAARRLVGALAHPLNRAVIDPDKNVIAEGYGILQPRVDISVKSASRSRFASLLSGDTGFDIYTRAVSDVYQDLFGEGIFTGKGIYEVETFQKVLEHRFPCNAVLSHDLIEGAYARAGLVSDVEVVDDYPSHFSAFSRRKHRWVRGDWQIVFSLLPRHRNYFGQTVLNPLNYISRWKILDNLRRSLTEFATMLLLLYGWLLAPDHALRWTVAALALMLFPTFIQLLVMVLTTRKSWFQAVFWRDLGRALAGTLARIWVRLAFLCHQSLIDLDAVVRTLIRMKLTHRRLLEWETAADAESESDRENVVDVYLKWSILLTIAMGPIVYILHPRSLMVAMPFLVLWAASAWIVEWLNEPRQPLVKRIKAKDRDTIRNAALRTWRFFREFSNPSENWLIPDIVQDASPLVAHRVSPTNLGLLLNSRLAAHDLGYLTMPEFIRDTEKTFDAVSRMPRCNGHLYNWYETDSLRPVPPFFVSTVDSGNLVASLWTLKQGCLDMIQKPLFHPAMWAGLRDVAVQLAEAAQKNCGASDLGSLVLDLTRMAEEIASENAIPVGELGALEIDALLVLKRVSESGGNEEVVWWARELSARATSLLALIKTLAPWLEEQFQGAAPSGAEIRRLQKGLTLESIPRIYREISKGFDDRAAQATTATNTRHFQAALEKSARLAEDFAKRLICLSSTAQSMADDMDFSFLFDQKKKLFSVGYEECEGVISKCNYDLLASEARTAVFVAIAKGDVPQESWFRLGRSYRTYKRDAVLLSWSGTMFEYVMPCLWLRGYPNTLLDNGVRSSIRAQQKFARERGIPWGISESSCAQRNPDGHYYYYAFGVPCLALRGDDCSGDLVVAPYASFLGLMFDMEGSLENFRRLKELGLLSAYGFYEAVDFSPKRNCEPDGHVVVRNWMAHHQGMSLVAAANVLCDSVMQRRFHAEPRVAAIERLLHERQPRSLSCEEDAEWMSESDSALAALATPTPRPGFRDLVPKLLVNPRTAVSQRIG
jgi:cyclic beta-1,2-glucan synthetase